MAAISLIAFAVFAVIDWVAAAQEQTTTEYVAKPAALAALLVYATTGADPSGWLVAALVLSLLGDVYLMLPANLFMAGLSAFLLAHVAYIADFDATLMARVAWWIVTLAISTPIALRVLTAIPDARLRGGVAVYMAVIGLMVGSALASGSVVAAVGAILFFFSDAIIAWDRFVGPQPWARPAIMITYHLGQFLLVTVLRAG